MYLVNKIIYYIMTTHITDYTSQNQPFINNYICVGTFNEYITPNANGFYSISTLNNISNNNFSNINNSFNITNSSNITINVAGIYLLNVSFSFKKMNAGGNSHDVGFVLTTSNNTGTLLNTINNSSKNNTQIGYYDNKLSGNQTDPNDIPLKIPYKKNSNSNDYWYSSVKTENNTGIAYINYYTYSATIYIPQDETIYFTFYNSTDGFTINPGNFSLQLLKKV